MDVKTPTIVGILTFMSMTSFMNVLRLILSRIYELNIAHKIWQEMPFTKMCVEQKSKTCLVS